MNRFPFALSKFLVYLRLWGFRQTLYKILGRTNLCLPLSLPTFKKNILVIGCGQFAFSTLAPRLLLHGLFSPIALAYDPIILLFVSSVQHTPRSRWTCLTSMTNNIWH